MAIPWEMSIEASRGAIPQGHEKNVLEGIINRIIGLNAEVAALQTEVAELKGSDDDEPDSQRLDR